MIKALRRATNLFFALLIAVFSVNLSGVLTLQNAHAAANKPILDVPTAGKITICHSHQPNASQGGGLGPQENPYDQKDVSVDATDGEGTSDHTGHTGVVAGQTSHVFHPGDLSWGDIIPAYPAGTYKKGSNTYSYPASDGLNWTPEGQAIFYNGCELPVVLPKDASATLNVTPPTCLANGSINIINTVNASLVGALDQSVGTHTITFTASQGHLFADGTTTFNFTYTIGAQLTGIQCAGPQPDDDHETRIVSGAPVCLPNGTSTVTSWTEERSRSYTFDPVSNSWVAGLWSNWTKVANSETTVPAQKVCPVEVTPTTPTALNDCGIINDKYVIPKTNGVRYEIKVGQIGQTELYAPISDGTYPTLGASSVKIRAVAKNGFVLAAGSYIWTLTFNTANCPVDAIPPTILDECGNANDKLYVPTTNHVTYKKLVGYFLWVFPVYSTLNAGSQPGTGTVKIKAFADAGYDISGTDTWIFTFTDVACGTPNVTASAICDPLGVIVTLTNSGNADGTVTVNGAPVTVPANDNVTITVPLTLFKANVTILDGQTVLLDKAFDCTPGRGNAGGPNTPSVVLANTVSNAPTGIVMPETGAHPLVSAFTLALAGLTTYGVMFFLINRRELTHKK